MGFLVAPKADKGDSADALNVNSRSGYGMYVAVDAPLECAPPPPPPAPSPPRCKYSKTLQKVYVGHRCALEQSP
mgnify:CR=1 FL=1